MVIYTCPKCGRDLQEICLTSLPPQYQYCCLSCGWKSVARGNSEIDERIPYADTTSTDYDIMSKNIKATF